MANSSMVDDIPAVPAQDGEKPKQIEAALDGEDRSELIRGHIRRTPFRLVGNWLIGSTIVAVTPSSLIEGRPDVGREATVVASRSADASLRATRIDIREPKRKPAPRLGYLLNPFGTLAALTLLLPVALALVPYLPDYGTLTIIMTEMICIGVYAFAYFEKKALWERTLRQRVRGTRGVNVRSLAVGALGISMVVGFVAAMGGVRDLREWLPGGLYRFVVPPMQMLVFFGITFFFSIMAAMQYMAMLEELGSYLRPLYLQSHVDPVGLGMQSLEAGLGIPADAGWKIVERRRLPSGGVWFILHWMETIVRVLPSGERKEFLQEKRYEVEFSASGQIVSYAERR